MLRGAEELESKHRVSDPEALVARLEDLGYQAGDAMVQVDEYFDTPAGGLAARDLVLRLRTVDSAMVLAFKGPREPHDDGTYSRVEVELSLDGVAERVRADLTAQEMRCTRHIEKRRREFRSDGSSLTIALDELPVAGFFVEIEGDAAEIGSMAAKLGDLIGPPEQRNYFEILRAYPAAEGPAADGVTRFAFSKPDR